MNITAENEYHERLHEKHEESSGIFSSTTKDVYDYSNLDAVVGSNISGGSVDVTSGADTNITASNVVADNDVNIKTGGELSIGTQEQTSESEYIKKVKKSGIFAGGGFGITIGSEKQRDEYANKNVENVGSTVGSIEGSVNLEAKDDATVTGSEVIAGKDINITGKNVNIESSENVYNAHEEHEYKRTGITVSVGGQAIDIAEEAIGHIERAGQVEDERLAALHAYKAYDTVTEVTQKKDNWSTLENAVKDPAKNLSLNVSFGTEKSESSSDSTTVVAQGSNVKAEGDVAITSSEEDINIKGSNVEGENVTLNAAKDLNVTASKDSNVTKQDSESSSASIGVGMDLITGKVESINIGGSKAEGTVDANSTSYNESTVTADKELDFTSGEDTNIVGGKISGEKVTGNVGGNLNIESQQDSNNYSEENKSAGFNIGISVVPGKDNPNKSGIYGNASESNIDSKYDSVTDQSGIYAGDEGFDIYVEDNTDLKGGIISGDNTDENKLSTGTLTYEDINNEAEYEAGSHGVAIDTSEDADRKDAGLTPNPGMSVSDEADSTTKATVSEGEIEIRDKENQKQDIAGLNRDAQNALNKLGEIFDKNDVKEKQEFIGLAQELGHKMIGDLTGKISLEQKAMLNAFLEGLISQWANGDFSGAAGGAAAVEMAKQALWEIKDPAVRQWAAEILGAVVSKAAGGEASTGASSAVNTEKYNGLNHEEQEKLIHDLQHAKTLNEKLEVISNALERSLWNKEKNPAYGEAMEQLLLDELEELYQLGDNVGFRFKVDKEEGLTNNLNAAKEFIKVGAVLEEAFPNTAMDLTTLTAGEALETAKIMSGGKVAIIDTAGNIIKNYDINDSPDAIRDMVSKEIVKGVAIYGGGKLAERNGVPKTIIISTQIGLILVSNVSIIFDKDDDK